MTRIKKSLKYCNVVKRHKRCKNYKLHNKMTCRVHSKSKNNFDRNIFLLMNVLFVTAFFIFYQTDRQFRSSADVLFNSIVKHFSNIINSYSENEIFQKLYNRYNVSQMYVTQLYNTMQFYNVNQLYVNQFYNVNQLYNTMQFYNMNGFNVSAVISEIF